MDISVFSSYAKYIQSHDFFDQTQNEFLDSLSKSLYSIRTARKDISACRDQIQKERQRRVPNPVVIASLRRDILRTMQPAINTMDSINTETQSAIGARVFDISGTNVLSSTVRNEFDKNADRYIDSLHIRILRDPFRIPESKRNTPYEDRKYIESFFRDEEIRERVKTRPDPPPKKEWTAEQRAQSLGNRYLKEGSRVIKENNNTKQFSKQRSEKEKDSRNHPGR